MQLWLWLSLDPYFSFGPFIFILASDWWSHLQIYHLLETVAEEGDADAESCEKLGRCVCHQRRNDKAMDLFRWRRDEGPEWSLEEFIDALISDI